MKPKILLEMESVTEELTMMTKIYLCFQHLRGAVQKTQLITELAEKHLLLKE